MQTPKSRINFSITQLEYVWAVRKHGHFARAAEACHVTQPTLSMQIQKLEEDLGVILFDRSKKPILLTEIGKQLIDQIHNVLTEAHRIQTIIEAETLKGVQGELTLGIIPTIAPYLLPILLPKIASLYPQLKLKISELQTQQIIEALDNDEIDAAILAIPLNIGKIHELPLYFEPFQILCKRDHPMCKYKRMKYNKLTTNDIWLLEEGHCLRNQVLDICDARQNRKSQGQFQFESGNLETLKNLVNTYGGYTLLPQLAVQNIGSETCLIHFERPIPSREIGLVYQRAHHKIQLIEALAESISDSLPDEIRNIRPKDLDILDIEKPK